MQYQVVTRPQSREKGQNLFACIINEPDFSRTNGRVGFLVLLCGTILPSFGKILRAVFEKKW